MGSGVFDFVLAGMKGLGASIALLLIMLMVGATVMGQDEDATAEAIALFNKGQDAHEKGDLKGAIASYEEALKIFPEFPEAELQRGSAYQSMGRLDEAETAFRRSVELREDWSLALANLGSVLVRKVAYSDAEPYLTKAIELDELNFPAYAALTELRLKSKAPQPELQTLLAKLRDLTAKANPTASIWTARAALEIAAGDRKNAKMSSAKALELDPKCQFALSTAADISLLENDPAAADSFVMRLESAAPNSELAKSLRARVLLAQGKPDEARTLLASISNPGPDTTLLRNQIIAATTTDTAELEKQLLSDPKSAQILSRLCKAFRTNDPAKALDYCRRASESAPDEVEPVIGYAAALVQAKRYEDAVVVLRRLLSIAPDNITARANLATALFQLKRYAEAKVEFRWLTDHQPNQAIAYYFLAIVHDQLQEFADAAANYQQFLRTAEPESSKLEIEKVHLRLPIVLKLIKEGKGKKRG
jgi:Flp pilus assembly protein TadD